MGAEPGSLNRHDPIHAFCTQRRSTHIAQTAMAAGWHSCHKTTESMLSEKYIKNCSLPANIAYN
jgi:hypothetical protein